MFAMLESKRLAVAHCCAQRVTIGIGLVEATDLFMYLGNGGPASYI